MREHDLRVKKTNDQKLKTNYHCWLNVTIFLFQTTSIKYPFVSYAKSVPFDIIRLSITMQSIQNLMSVGRTSLLLIILLTVIAYGLRVIGTESSVAYLDDVQIVRQSMEIGQRLTRTQDFDTSFQDSFKYPLTLTLYLSGVYGVFYVIGNLVGWFESVSAFQTFLFANREVIHILAVYAFNLLSVLLIPALYWSHRRLNPKHSGWLMAGLATFNLLLVHFGHQPRPHVPLATLGFCATVLQVMIANRVGGWRVALLGTILSALTVGTLQNGIVIAIPFGLAWLLRPLEDKTYRWRQLFHLLPLSNILLFVVLSGLLYPGLMQEYGGVIVGYLSGESNQFLLGGTSHDFSLAMFSLDNIPQFISRLASYQPLLTYLLPFALVYFIVAHRHAKRLLIVGLAFPCINLIIWSLFRGTFPRITAVLIPFMIFGVAYMIEDAVLWMSSRWHMPLGRLRLIVFGIIITPLALSAGRLVWVTAQQDTRTIATQWISENLPEGETLLLNAQMNELYPTNETIERQATDYPGSISTFWQWLSEQPDVEEKRYSIYSAMYWRNLPDDSELQRAFIAEENIRYIVARTLVAHPTVDSMIAFAQENGKLVQVFCPAYGVDVAELPTDLFAQAWQQIWTLESAGPYVAIYDLTLPPDEPIVEVYCEGISDMKKINIR